MIYVSGEHISDSVIKVLFTHYMPLDPEHGLSKDTISEGYLVDVTAPPPPEDNGKLSELYYNFNTNEFYYEYIEVPKSPTLEEVNEKLDLIMQSMLESEGIL